MSASVFTDVDTMVNEASDTVCNSGIDIGTATVEFDDRSDAEEGRMARFFAGGCSCKLVNGGPCHKSITPSEYRVMRDECRALTHDELDLVVMGQLRALTQNDDMTQKVRATNTKRIRSSTQFQFGGHRVCIDTFCFLHCMSQKRFKCIKSSWMENGLRPRTTSRRTPHNTTRLSDVEDVVRFIFHFAEDNAILLPGRIPGYKRDDLQLLPSSTTKRQVWELYHDTISRNEDAHAI